MKIKKICSILLSVALVFALFTGCGDKSGSASGDDDTLYLRLSSPLQSTDWQQVSNLDGNKITNTQLFEGLYGIDEAEGGYYNLLAKNIDISKDEKVYTIELVDATFQNGDPLTAEDVVFSYNLAMENSKYGYVTSMIDKVEAKDDKTVVLTLKYPYAAIAHTFFTIKIISEREYNEITESGGTFGTAPHKAGTGPYYVTEYDVSAGVKLEAYEDYWQGAPSIKKVEYMAAKQNVIFKIMEIVRKGKKSGGLSQQHIDDMIAHGIEPWYLESCKKIQYLFPKGHAAAYVTMSLRIAYYKVYYKEAYYAAFYTIRADGFDYETMAQGEERPARHWRRLTPNRKTSRRPKIKKPVRCLSW